MDPRRLLTARVAGGFALLAAALVVGIGLVGVGNALTGARAASVLVPGTVAGVFVAALLWAGHAGARSRRTPYW